MPKTVDYTDSEGYQRRVSMPDNAIEDNPEMGIPISLDISEFIPMFNPVQLSNYLFERGVITPDDFLNPENTSVIVQCLRRFYAIDAASLQSLALNVKRGKI